MRAVSYFAESVRNKNSTSFHAIMCASWNSFTNYECFNHGPKLINHMGIDANTKVFGNFYLQTNDKPEFSKDVGGLIFNNFPNDHAPFHYLN